MKLDELRKKYPNHLGVLNHEPKLDCRHCHGAGERRTLSRHTPLTPCLCTCIDHDIAEDMQDALSQTAKTMLAELRAVK